MSLVLVASFLIAPASAHTEGAPYTGTANVGAPAFGFWFASVSPGGFGGEVLGNPTHGHNAAVVFALDNMYGQDVGVSSCEGNVPATSGAPAPAGCTEPACGPVYHPFTTPQVEVTVYVYAIVVEPTGNVCFGTAGAVFATMM